MKTKLRVGFDVDEVLYPWCRAFAHYLQTEEGWAPERTPTPTTWDFQHEWGMADRDEFLTLAGRAARSGLLHSWGQPLDGAVDVTQRLLAEGHTVHIVTARGRGRDDATWTATKAWLDEHGIGYTTLDFAEDKTSVPTDIYLDDKIENVDAITAAGAVGVVMDAPHNQVPDRTYVRTRVRSLEEYGSLVDWLADYYEEHPREVAA